jgi:hypothetical protein
MKKSSFISKQKNSIQRCREVEVEEQVNHFMQRGSSWTILSNDRKNVLMRVKYKKTKSRSRQKRKISYRVYTKNIFKEGLNKRQIERHIYRFKEIL